MLSALWLLLRGAGALQSLPLCIFLIALSASVCYGIATLLPADRSRLTLTFRRIVLAVLIVGIPVLIDPTTAEAVNVARFALVVTAAVALLASWVVDWAWTGRRPSWVNGLQWPTLALLLWAAVSWATSEDRRVSLLGAYGSYHGLILIAALVVIEIGISDAFRLEDLRQVVRAVGLASVPVVVYGLVQVHDQLFGGRHWDFIPWQLAQPHAFSTFGNPDHLAGYLATVLGITAIAAILSRGTLRYVLAVTAVLSVALLVETAGRGGWLGAFVVAVVLLVAYGRSVLAHPRAAAGAGVVAALGVVVFVLGAHRIVGSKLSTLFSVGAGSSVAERFGYWGAAVHAGSHHLLTGTGLDTFSIVYQRYQSRSLASSIGINGYVNGAHDIFLNTFSEEGVIGLACLVVLLVFALWWTLVTWRRGAAGRHKSFEVPVTAAPSVVKQLRKGLAVALFASFAAYVAQGSFDTLQVGTDFHFWLLLGLIASLLASTWPVHQLRVGPWAAGRQVDDTAPLRAEDDENLPSLESRRAAVRRRSRGGTRVPVWVPVAVAGGLAAVTITAWRATSPWRADHSYWAASRATTNTAVVSYLLDARATNPWEPSYDERLGQVALNSYSRANQPTDRVVYLNKALTFLGDAAQLQPLNASVAFNYAQALVLLAQLQPSPDTVNRAFAAARQAAEDDPYNTELNTLFTPLKKLRS